MTGPAIPDHVFERLPDWRGADCTELDGGLNNRTWRLDRDGASAVLKFDTGMRTLPYNSRRDEAQIQSAAAADGLAGRVLYADDDLLLCEFLEGTVWTADSFNADNLAGLARSLRRLHTLPPTGRTFDAAGAARLYLQDLDGRSPAATICRDTIAAARTPEPGCCCHNDLVAGNIIATPGIRFLDWEYACDNDPLFDLATIVEHHELSEKQAQFLLDAYFEDGGPRREQFMEQRRLYLALLWLWLASRPGSPASQLERVADRLATSCS